MFTHNYNITHEDLNKPWGGYQCIDNKDLDRFIQEFFHNYPQQISTDVNISPKLLFINSNSRLSWQYHFRRKELWKVVIGPVGVVRSLTDVESDIQILNTGDIILLDATERHRLVGLNKSSIVAELWIHTDIHHPSDESDIVRVTDDYGR